MRLNISVHRPRNIIQLFDLMQIFNCIGVVLLNIRNSRFSEFSLHICFFLFCQSLWFLFYFFCTFSIWVWINFIKWLWFDVTQWMDDILTSLLMSVGSYRWLIIRHGLPVADLRRTCKLVKKLRFICAIAIISDWETFSFFTNKLRRTLSIFIDTVSRTELIIYVKFWSFKLLCNSSLKVVGCWKCSQ